MPLPPPLHRRLHHQSMELNKPREEQIFQSKLPDIHIPNHLPTHTYSFQKLPNHRSRPAIINAATGQVFTHSDVDLTSRKVAAGLHRLGVRKGHVIMLLLHNSPEFAFSLLAASFIGATTTTANPLYTTAEIEKQAKIAAPKLIITHARYVGKVSLIFAGETSTKIITIDAPPPPPPTTQILHFSELSKSDEKSLPNVVFDAEDTAALPFSSGTTGLPKAVMLSHRNLVTCVSQQVDGENPSFHVEEEDVVLCVLPLFHVFSMITVLLCSLRVGAAIVIMEKFEIDELMGLVEKYRVTIASVVPPIMLALAKSPAAMKYDLSSVRRVICGAAPLDEKLASSVQAKLPNAVIGQGYGMTEAGVLSMSLGFAKIPFKFKSGSCGTVIRNARMKIVDPLTGASLPRNQTGEICVKGDEVMKGYLNDPEATKSTIDGDGWLHSGDLGYVDDEDELYVVARLKELIKYKGFHVAPAELESLLIAHPSISDAAVVPMRDENAGEIPVAFVVRASDSCISEQEIKEYIANKVVSYKRIHRILFTSEIPKAPSGKILRKNLRARI